MENKQIYKKSQNNNNNNNKNLLKFNNLLLNIHKFKLYPPPLGSFYTKPNINPNLNFSILEPILLKEKKTLIGDGSFSKVFLYYNKKTKTKYAIKRMNISKVLEKTNNKNIIINEINIQSKISHPNIIKLYNFFSDRNDSYYYLILEYASKGSLFDYIKFKNGLNESNAFYYFIQAVNAIYFLHKYHIIHRDLKPENLLINQDNILKLCDFGWSVYLLNNKRGTFCGTVEYMAPEILKNQGYDYSIDVWSLGVLLYELIHSYSPFVVNDLDINKIENNIVTKELKFQKKLSNDCKDLITKLLMKNAEKRMKIEDIYEHPFVLRYINMINLYIKVNKMKNENINNNSNENKKIFNNNNSKIKDEKSNKNKSTIINASQDSFSEFETVPNEPEVKNIPVNYGNIVRNSTKIKINQEENIKSNRTYINNNFIKNFEHKKTLSLNNLKFEDNNFNNDNKELFIKKKLKNESVQKYKINYDKLLLKEMNEFQNINNHITFEELQYTIMEPYSNNLIKTKSKKNINFKNQLNSNKNSKNSSNKNLLITSYKVKLRNKHSNIINRKILNNFTSINQQNKKSKIMPNCNSVSYINFSNSNIKSSQNNSINLNSYNNSKNKKKPNKKGKVFIKHEKTLNKKANLSYSDIIRINSNDINQKKFTLNLSNINVINVFNNSCSNDLYHNYSIKPKIIQKINTYFIRDLSKKNFIINQGKKEINSKKQNTMKNSKKIPSKLYLKIKKKSNFILLNNSENQRKNSQRNVKTNEKSLMSFSRNNKLIEKKQIYNTRNMVKNIELKNSLIPPLKLIYKK